MSKKNGITSVAVFASNLPRGNFVVFDRPSRENPYRPKMYYPTDASLARLHKLLSDNRHKLSMYPHLGSAIGYSVEARSQGGERS